MTAPILVEHAAAQALHSAWESLLLALGTAGLFRFLPRLSPRERFLAGIAAFVLAAVLPFLPTGTLPTLGEGGAGPAPSIPLPPEAAPMVAAAWLLCSSVLFLRLVFSAISLRALLRAAEPAQPALQELYRSVATGRARRARLLVADNLSAPSACGLLRPAVLLPRMLTASLTQEELAAILRHEAAHLNGGDDWLALALRLTRALLPFALGLPAIERRLLAAREMLCDDAALGGVQGLAPSRKGYAACLARLAELRPGRAHVLAPGLGGSELSLRIGYILSGGPGRLRSTAAALAGAALCLGLLAAPAVFSFEPAPALPSIAQTGVAALPTRPASFELASANLSANMPANTSAKKRRAAHRKQLAPTRPAVYQTVFFAAPQPRVILLIPASEPLPAFGWSRFFLLTI